MYQSHNVRVMFCSLFDCDALLRRCVLDFEYLLWHALTCFTTLCELCVRDSVAILSRNLCHLAVSPRAQAYFSGAGHLSRPVLAFSALSHRGSLTDTLGPSPIQTTNGDSLGVCAGACVSGRGANIPVIPVFQGALSTLAGT